MVCSYWNRHSARAQRWDGVEVSADELVRIRDAQVAEDKKDPPCQTCNACLLLLENDMDTPLPFTDVVDFNEGDTLDQEISEDGNNE